MPSIRNQNQLKGLKDKFSRAKSVVFADYAGLSMADQTKLRTDVAAAGGEFSVAKNTLIKLALEGSHPSRSGMKSELQGPTAVLFAYQDEVQPLKILVKFASDHELPKVKGGWLGKLITGEARQTLTLDQVLALAKLPGKEELIVKLMGQIQGPMYGMVRTLNGNITKLIYALEAIRRVKS